MNIRNNPIEIQCGHKDIADVAKSLIHSVIFFRTHGKFNYKHEGSYFIGTLGYEVVVCDHLDFTYLRCTSPALVNRIDEKVQEFADKFDEFASLGTVSLEFYTKRPSRWPFNDAKILWEVWNIKIVIQPSSRTSAKDGHVQRYANCTAKIEDVLSQKLLDVIKIVNNNSCSLPPMPTQTHLETVFDTSCNDLQPYLYNISYRIIDGAPSSHSAGGASAGYADRNGITAISSPQTKLRKFLLGTLEL